MPPGLLRHYQRLLSCLLAGVYITRGSLCLFTPAESSPPRNILAEETAFPVFLGLWGGGSPTIRRDKVGQSFLAEWKAQKNQG